jgi:hypothetical protein
MHSANGGYNEILIDYNISLSSNFVAATRSSNRESGCFAHRREAILLRIVPLSVPRGCISTYNPSY